MPVGGDITEITWNHPTKGSGVLKPKSNEDSTFDEGGIRGNDDANMITTGGQSIRQLNRVRWSFEGTMSWDMNSADEVKQMRDLAGDPVEATFTISHINGTVWKGTGSPVGDIQGNANTATFNLKIAGSNDLKKIVG
ncbi:MAG: hypothetical protein K0S44_210 [Bacteroidetes bacterium]|jgi:hypothetical protein|nr:hypothetical protein [Bacteroidota bacterium]